MWPIDRLPLVYMAQPLATTPAEGYMKLSKILNGTPEVSSTVDAIHD